MSHAEKPAILGEELPCLYINRFHVTATMGLVRIAFAEQALAGSGQDHPRTVVIMSSSDAAELGTVLRKVAEDLAKAEAEARRKSN